DAGFAHLAATTDEHRLRWKPMLDRTPGPQSGNDLPYPIREADIDLLMHMNNAAYWQAVEQFLPARPELPIAPHRAVIEYNAPLTADQPLRIRPEDRTSGLHLWFLTGESVSAAAQIGPYPHIHDPVK
ncbi:hypothetical protein GL309_26695, partial [Nocardia seriolae]|nr:hypothetical protein [Nocardia seriolae]